MGARDEEKGETSSMSHHMPDSPLNGPERRLQHSLMKSPAFNALFMVVAFAAIYLPLRELPNRRDMPKANVPIDYRSVQLEPVDGPFRLAGAWEVSANDRRFGGLSSLTLDGGQFLSVSDFGAVVRFDPPASVRPRAHIADLSVGPGPRGKKRARDAESLASDPSGRGWWIGYEQHHSLWLYDRQFGRALANVELNRDDWWDNHGAEGLIADRDGLLVFAENGQEAMRVGLGGIDRIPVEATAEVADAASTPDGQTWLLLRTKGRHGISQWIAPLVRKGRGYGIGQRWPLPKDALDNYEGLAIEPLATDRWRIWLVTDSGHRFMARTLVIALDFEPAGHDKSPALGAGPSKELAAGDL